MNPCYGYNDVGGRNSYVFSYDGYSDFNSENDGVRDIERMEIVLRVYVFSVCSICVSMMVYVRREMWVF